METGKRRLRSGKEFDHLFPPPSGNDETIKKEANVEDTMKFIRRAIPKTLWQTQKIAKVLKGRTLEETCSNIWHFVYEHIQYKRDEDGVEQVRSPRRAWYERKSGVDCDCYTVFITSILHSMGIDCVARIAKYPKPPPEVPRWQHVYVLVPRAGHWDNYTDERYRYIVLDCVKDRFDDEEPYVERKDYTMRLDYLDGIEDEGESQVEAIDTTEYDNVDLSDLASIYDEEEMGNIFKKAGNALKKAATTVTTTVKKAATEVKQVAKKAGNEVKQVTQKVSDKVGDGIRFLNRYVNPATVLLRNGFLLAMKINMLNVAGRLRYAYLNDAQAQAKNMNLAQLQKVRAIKDRAETIYWQAGGKKENLQKAILSGKGNRDQAVSLAGLNGLDKVYADVDEYRIIHGDSTEGLGEIATATALAAAASAVAAIAASLKQVTGLFNHGGKQEQAFQSETDNAGSESSAPSTITENEDALTNQAVATAQAEAPIPATVSSPASTTPAVVRPPGPPQQVNVTSRPVVIAPLPPREEPVQQQTENINTNEKPSNAQAQPYSNQAPAQANESAISTPSSPDGSAVARTGNEAADTPATTQSPAAQKEGFIQKTSTWVKENPGKSLLVAGGLIAGTFLLAKSFGSKSPTNGLDGTQGSSKQKRKKHKPKNKQRKKNSTRKVKVKPQILM